MPKALVELDGLPLVSHAARGLAASGAVDEIVVTAPAGLVERLQHLLRTDPEITCALRVVAGGPTRQASVAAGLDAASTAPSHGDDRRPSGPAVVLVHDAARPLTPPRLVARVAAAVRDGHRAVVPGLPVTDTIKTVEPAGPGSSTEVVVGTPDRSALRAVQTPQGFEAGLLRRAHAEGAARAVSEATAATDDAGLVEALGVPVHVVPGDVAAMKITTGRDLAVAALMLQEGR